jgi:hypothetical protein
LEEISWIPNEHKQLLVRNGQAILAFQTEFLQALEEAYRPQSNVGNVAFQSRDLRAIARCFSQLVSVLKESKHLNDMLNKFPFFRAKDFLSTQIIAFSMRKP